MQTSRSIPNVKKCVLAGGLLGAALIPCIAAAALGEPEASVQAIWRSCTDRSRSPSTRAIDCTKFSCPPAPWCASSPGSDGKVFAVAWNGPNIPNLRQTFGRYYDNYVTAAKANACGHTHLQIQQSDLVVQSSGHMRAFSGRAYLPQAVPSGVDLGELR